MWYHNVVDEFLSQNQQKAAFAWKTSLYVVYVV